MAKMYYSEEETCKALNIDLDGLMEYVNSRKLQMYQDGSKHVYKASDVDVLAEEVGTSLTIEEDTEVELSPSGPDETASLSDAKIPAEHKKGDTVITAEGISIFDDEDLEIEEADPMAETQVAPSLDDQIALDGVGSGSGLLDLTRESDDTSLGADVLDHIDMEGMGSGVGSGMGSGLGSGLSSGLAEGLAESGISGELDTISTSAGYPQAAVAEPATYVEIIDPGSGLFGGLLVGAALIMLIVTATTLAAQRGIVSGLLAAMQNNMAIVLGIMIVLTIAAAVVGYLLGKAFQTRQEALQQVG